MDEQENIAPNSFPNSVESVMKTSSQLKLAVDTDSSSKPTNDLKSQVREQIEFYLSDANLYNDPYLRSIVLSTEEQRVSIDLLLSFNKIK